MVLLLDEICEDPQSFEEYDVFDNDVTDLTEVIIVYFFFEPIVYKFQYVDNKTFFLLTCFSYVDSICLGAPH